MYRTATFDPGIRMKEEDIEATVALTSDNRRPTHSGTGEGSGREDAISRSATRNFKVFFVENEVRRFEF